MQTLIEFIQALEIINKKNQNRLDTRFDVF